MDFDLDRITDKAPHYPDTFLIHGLPGMGKTAMGAQFPKPVVLMGENEMGLQKLIDKGDIPPVNHFPQPVTEWGQAMGALNALYTKKHDYKTLVIDTVDALVNTKMVEVLRDEFGGNDSKKEGGFNHYGAGAEKVTTHWRTFLGLLERLNKEREMMIVLLAHTRVKRISPASGEDYDAYELDLPPKVSSATASWADNVYFLTREVDTAEVGKKVKADTVHRVLHADIGPSWYAKKKGNGFPAKIKLPNTIEGAYKALAEELSKAAKAAKDAKGAK